MLIESEFIYMHAHIDLDVQIKVVPYVAKLDASGQWVTISWKSTRPDIKDWVGMWVLPDPSASIDAAQRAPVKYQVAY